MKLVPLLTAALVTGALYLFVFERDALLVFAQSEAVEANEVVQAAAEGPIATDARQIGVVALKSVAQRIDDGVVLRGQTEAVRQVEVRAEISGLVISDPLRKGAFIDAGATVCELDPGTREAQSAEARALLTEAKSRVPEAEARLVEARARVSETAIELNAAQRLSQGGFASESRVAAAEAASDSALAGVQAALAGVSSARSGIQSADAAVASAQKEISRLTIAAPFAGLLESDTAELGSLLQPGSPCATIIQLDPIKLVGFVPETEVGRVGLGARVGARLASGREVAGKVTFVSRSADETTRTFRIEASVPNEDLSIRDGQTAEMLVSADGTQAHLLPQSALTLDDAGALGVRIVDAADKAAFRTITLLRDTVDGVWVSGLPEIADVIVVGQDFVTDGVPVRATYREAANDEATP